MPLRCFFCLQKKRKSKKEKKKNTYFQGFLAAYESEGGRITHHPSHCQPFSEMFHASLSTDRKVRVASCPPVPREMIVALQAKLPQSME